MRKANIKELVITEEMYKRAKEVENLSRKTKNMDCRTEEFRKLNNKWIKLDDKFQEEISDEFDSLEIVNEYERRKRNSDRMLSPDVNTYRFTYKNGAVRDYKFYSCIKDKNRNKYYVLRNICCGHGAILPDTISSDNIEKVECIERNNNIDYK